MDKSDYLAYEGEKFSIEWFVDKDGVSQSKKFYENSSRIQQDKILMLFKRMGDVGKVFDKTKFRNEGDSIYAFKPKPDRYLFFLLKGKKLL